MDNYHNTDELPFVSAVEHVSAALLFIKDMYKRHSLNCKQSLNGACLCVLNSQHVHNYIK